MKDELKKVKKQDFNFNRDMFTGTEDTSEADLFVTEFEARLRDDLIQWKAISGDNVVYDVVDSYISLMEKVMK